MSQPNPFDRKHIEESAVLPQRGLLEHLNLPPAAAEFIRRNQRAIWIVVICVALIVTALSLYGSYRSYREDKASSALTVALQAQGEEKKKLLEEIVDNYGSTTAGMWSRIEIVHMAEAEGNTAGAIAGLIEVENSVSAKNPVAPLLAYNLGMLHEKNNDPDQALASYKKLLAFKGFEAVAYKAMGRIYELQDNKDQALEMYKKYLETGEAGNGQPDADPDRSLIQARVNRLEK